MKRWVIPVILVLMFGFLMFYAYLKWEKPIDEQLDKQINLSVYSEDEWGNLISTGFEIHLDNQLFQKGSTLSQAPIRYIITNNSKIEIFNVNKGKQNYYTDKKTYNSFEKELVRVDMVLIKPSVVEIERLSKWENESEIILNLSTSNFNRGTHMCVDYTTHFIYVKSNETQLEDEFLRYDKCFDLKINLNKTTSKIVYLNYKIWGDLEHKDYINLYFIDTEEGVGFDEEDKDLFAKNTLETFGINNI